MGTFFISNWKIILKVVGAIIIVAGAFLLGLSLGC